MKSDIKDRTDIQNLVTTFYQSAIPDPVIGYFFTQVVNLDLEEHLPRLTDFWSTLLLRVPAYSGSVAQVHMALNQKSPIEREHLERWVSLWCDAVDSLFCGPIATQAKDRGAMVARSLGMHLEDANFFR